MAAEKLKSELEKQNGRNSVKILNSLKISLSVIGAVVGAGFITGREILTFFSKFNPVFVATTLFLCFFALINFSLKARGEKIERAIKTGNAAIYVISIFIIASMLGATDSLFFSVFKLPVSVPLGSLLLICASTAVCFGGISKIEKANVFIVPAMLLIAGYLTLSKIFSPSYLVPPYFSEILSGGFFSFAGIYRCISYSSMNALLSQPFFCKIKTENKNFSPALVAAVSAFCLSVLVFIYLLALKGSVYEGADIPALGLAGGAVLKYLAAFAVLGGIITTQFSTEYPLVCLLKKRKKSGLLIVLLALVSFVLSRLGFYVIVDVIYPVIALTAAVYYIILISIKRFSFRLSPRRHTSARQARLKLRSKS
ncbi:MAG: hypothetical protein SOX77_05630 [Candidatus Borkfalkiaceae bacterium]|nr:hypothetical protein [Christensenellaceae bacterium]